MRIGIAANAAGQRRAARLIACLCATLVLSCQLSAFGQVNTEALRSNKDGVAGSLDASLALRRGNSDLVDVATSFRIDYRDRKNYTFLVGRVSYGTNNKNTYSNSAFTHLRYNRDFTSRLTGELFGQLERDGFTLLQLRALLGSGLRIGYLKDRMLTLYQGSSVMYENERLDASRVIEHPDRVSVVRWSNYLTLAGRFSDLISVSLATYVQPAFNDFSDIRIINDSSVEVHVTDHFSLTTSFRLRHDSGPPDGIEGTDLQIRNGLRARF